MRSFDLDRQRFSSFRSRIFGGRTSVQIVVGALAIAAIVLAFLFRPGQTAQDTTKSAVPPATAKPTAAATAAPTAVKPTAVPIVATAVPPSAGRTHTVVSGDNLSKLAETYYGDSTKSGKIFEANKDILKDPNTLQLGQKLKIPD